MRMEEECTYCGEEKECEYQESYVVPLIGTFEPQPICKECMMRFHGGITFNRLSDNEFTVPVDPMLEYLDKMEEVRR